MLLLTVYLYKRDLSSSRRRLLFRSWPVLKKSRVDLPLPHFRLKLPPKARTSFACSTLPLRHASCSRVIPSLCSESSGNRASGSAPSLRRKCIFLMSFSSPHCCSCVYPVVASVSFMSSCPLSYIKNSKNLASFAENLSKHYLKVSYPMFAPLSR
jgi:hypothetical protein